MNKKLATAAATLLLLGSAQAQMPPMPTASQLYGELGYTWLKVDAFGTSFRPDAIRGILGWDVHPTFAIEGMVGGGVSDDSKNLAFGATTANVNTKMDYMYGIWAKPRYIYDRSEFFGRFGWAHTKVEANRAGVSASESQDDFAWGLGANYRFNPNGYVGIDWMRYSNQSNSHVDGLTLSVGWHW